MNLGYLEYPEWISPVIIPGLPLRWYGLMYLIAFATSYLLFIYQAKERKLDVDKDEVLNLFFWMILGLLVGARIFATTIYDPTGYYLSRPWRIFWPFDENMSFTGLQGMSFHGGLVGVVVAFIIYCKVKRIDVLDWGDMLVTGIPLGYTFGRIGNFINAELYGRVTASPLGMLFPNARRVPADHSAAQRIAEEAGISIPDGAELINLPRHASQLYEAFGEGILVWVVLWFFFRKNRPFKGLNVAIYMIGYGLARFVVEYFREPDPGLEFVIQLGPENNPPWLLLSPWNFTTGQILSFLMIVAGVILLFVFREMAKRRPKVETFDTDGSSGSSESAGKRKRRRKARK
ncbi:MAG: prolipoprotein diacylglyceryl transferase [Spirochaetaceae bacterium]